MFSMSPLEDETKRGWQVLADGEEIHPKLLQLVSKYGTLTLGVRPEGYQSWCWKEAGGGGAVTILFSYSPEKKLYVGTVPEDRPNLGGVRLCAIGGMAESGRTKAELQQVETEEEAGVDTAKAVLLSAPKVNDRLFFIADAQEDEGVHFYAFELPFEHLVENSDESYRLRPDASVIDPERDRKREGLVFWPWYQAVHQSPDILVSAAVGLLLAHLTAPSSV